MPGTILPGHIQRVSAFGDLHVPQVPRERRQRAPYQRVAGSRCTLQAGHVGAVARALQSIEASRCGVVPRALARGHGRHPQRTPGE